MKKLHKLFAAAVVCALLSLSQFGGAQATDTDNAPFQFAALATSIDSVSADSTVSDNLTLAEYRELKKRVLKPGGGGGRPASNFKATPGGGFQEFDACCDSCGAGGCTGCNSGPKGLTCGSGLIAANCQVVDDVVTCVKKDD